MQPEAPRRHSTSPRRAVRLQLRHGQLACRECSLAHLGRPRHSRLGRCPAPCTTAWDCGGCTQCFICAGGLAVQSPGTSGFVMSVLKVKKLLEPRHLFHCQLSTGCTPQPKPPCEEGAGPSGAPRAGSVRSRRDAGASWGKICSLCSRFTTAKGP